VRAEKRFVRSAVQSVLLLSPSSLMIWKIQILTLS